MVSEEKLVEYLRRVTAELQDTRSRLREFEEGRQEPLAVIGMACRFAGGVRSPEQLRDFVLAENDAIGDFPTDRGWDLDNLFHPDPAHYATSYVRQGGFLHDVDRFDAAFFGINPREALAMDPQQRLLLELTWEVLERAGLDPAALRESRTGVYVGVSSEDYISGMPRIPEGYEGYATTGSLTSVISGRVAYTFGFEGPAVTLDTACSASMVAIHTAGHALRQGDCELAVAGGVTVLSTPVMFTEFCRQRGLAPDGRCKPFAEAADGTGFSEGVGLVLLERLSDAQRNGHEVLAVIRGSAINQDGASNGLTAPNMLAQERVIRQALAGAGLSGADVDTVEAHGTGTRLGDPIEAEALLATYGADRPADRPLWVGSIKSNIGHTHAAAGVAGVIHTVMALRDGKLAKTLHIDEPTSHVDWNQGTVRLLTGARDWPRNGHPRRAAVSSFGVSGTNAHVILEQAPDQDPVMDGASDGPPTDAVDAADAVAAMDATDVVPWLVSGRTEAALRAQAARLKEFLAAAGDDGDPVDVLDPVAAIDVLDVGWSLATRRSALEQRAAVVGRTEAELIGGLEALAAGDIDAAVVRGTAVQVGAGPVLVFPGQGSQWIGMGVELLDSSPVFAARIAKCEAALSGFVDWSLTEVLRGVPGAPGFDRVDVVQPVLWAVMVSLAEVWASFGVVPAAVVGHSQGELAAAVVAGVLSLDDGARVVALRSQALRALSGRGAMASLAIGSEQAAEAIAGRAGVVVAAVNGPGSTVISGPPEAVAEVVAEIVADGGRARLIEVDYASHGPQVDEIAPDLIALLGQVPATDSSVAFYSTVTGARVDGSTLDAEYWLRNLREPVCFDAAMQALASDGFRVFIESSSHPVLTVGMQECLEQTGTTGVVLGTLRRDEGGPQRLCRALAEAYTAGVPIDWKTWFPADPTPRAVPLPAYAFQRERFWLPGGGAVGDLTEVGLTAHEHALLPASVELTDGGLMLVGRVSATGRGSWLAEHAVAGLVLLPGAALVEWVLTAADAVGGAGVEELALQVPVVLPASGALRIQVVIDAPDEAGRRAVRVHSRPEDETGTPEAWVCHASGTISPAAPEIAPATPQGLSGQWPPADAEPVPVEGFYERAAAAGYDYGPAFQGLTGMWRQGEDTFAEVSLPAVVAEQAGRFAIHPALLDAAMQPVLAAVSPGTGGTGRPMLLPFTWSGVSLWAGNATQVRVRLSAQPSGLRVLITDQAGSPVLTADAVVLRETDASQLRASGAARGSHGLFAVDWTPLPDGEDEAPEAFHIAVLGDAPTELEPSVVITAVRTEPTDLTDPTEGLSAAARVLRLAQDWLTETGPDGPQLAILTRSAVAADGMDREPVDPAAAAVWGLIRSAQTENPGRFLLIDTDFDPEVETDRAAVATALRQAVRADEPQIAVRAGRVLIPRMIRTDPAQDLTPPPGESAWCLAAGGTSVDDLTTVPNPQAAQPLGPGQVRIAVRAAGVNFRDVLIALGMYPDRDAQIGVEGAGVVVAAADDVTGVVVGDRVMGLFDRSFGTLAVADPRMVAPVPEDWDFREAAATPVAFLTAWYGLVELASVQAGDRVLIHTATGGVGLAALQIARYLGAEVYATASPAKHSVLEALGIDAAHRASSRDTSFEDAFRATTDGRGVDVVLNSLAGDLTDASLRLLSPGGRLIEMGKTDLRDPELVRHKHDVSYQAYDLIADAGPERISRMLAGLAELFATRTLRPVPVQPWPLARARQALRQLSQATHTGKLVLDVPVPLDPEGTVLVTGGTGTIGGQVAEHLVRSGQTRRLLLVSRGGSTSPGAPELADRLRELGAEVRLEAADAGDAPALAKVVGSVDPEHPLTGVVHAAGVLDDAMLGAQNDERLTAVWSAKAAAAAHLHALTADLPLGMFVLFSSFASTLGTAGQANYAAANAYCDALAQRRSAEGRPGVSVGWGLWAASSGLTAGLTEAALGRINRQGITATGTEQGLALFDAAQAGARPVVLALNLDVRTLAAQPAGSLPPPLRALAASGAGAAGPGPTSSAGRPTAMAGDSAAAPVDWPARLGRLAPAEQRRQLTDLVRGHAAIVLGHAERGAVPAGAAFKDLGFDSLTSVELRNRLSVSTGLRLPATVVFDYAEAGALAEHLRGRLMAGRDAEAPEPAAQNRFSPLLGQLAHLDEAMSALTSSQGAANGSGSPAGDPAAVTAGLEALLAKWKAEHAPAPMKSSSTAERLQDATTDQVLDFITNELGMR